MTADELSKAKNNDSFYREWDKIMQNAQLFKAKENDK